MSLVVNRCGGYDNLYALDLTLLKIMNCIKMRLRAVDTAGIGVKTPPGLGSKIFSGFMTPFGLGLKNLSG